MVLTEREVSAHIFLEETLSAMKQMELESAMNYFFQKFVTKTFCNATDKLKAVWEFASKNFKYVDDEADETLIAPKWMTILRAGDCDDFALFIKTCLRVLGITANFLLAGKTLEGFTHIAVISNGIILDGTSDKFNYLPKEYINLKVVA